MSVEPGVVDANILVYAVDTGAAQHAASLGLLQAARSPATVLFLTSQILCEFYSIVTNRRRIAVPYSPAEALEAISALLVLPGHTRAAHTCTGRGELDGLVAPSTCNWWQRVRFADCGDDAS
jgi:predicted nucleic acid-binding protein